MSFKLKSIIPALTIAWLMSLAGAASAGPAAQYATSVINFSSQWSTSSWSAQQVLGAPNTPAYGDIQTSWAPATRDGTLEYITVGFDTAVNANGAIIRETDGNGFVYQIDALDTSGILHTVWTGLDPTLRGSVQDFTVSWSDTPYLVNGLKMYVNTSRSTDWEETDSIQLLSGARVAAVPEPGSLTLLAMGLGLLGFRRSRR